ncbi:MAG: polysaccharide biosynthesis C-terminal domain-containing protein, partial [Fidelibacterota bacterium]
KWNRSYAAGLFVNSLFVFVLSLLGIFIADGKGYALGFVSAPALTAVVILSVLRYKRKASFGIFRIARDLPVKMSDYAKYGVYAGLGNIASQMAWQLDTIMIGAILAQSAEVAVYKAATLIPFSLIFIPSVFMQTDFVYIAERYKNKNYLLNYYKKYLLVFVLIVIAILAIWYAAGGLIVRIFGPEYIEARPLINVLMINVASTFLFRVPLGNILAAVGRAKWNSWSATVLLVVNFFLNYMLIPKFGVFGAAYATVTSISLSSLINIVLFAVYLKQIDKKVKQR